MGAALTLAIAIGVIAMSWAALRSREPYGNRHRSPSITYGHKLYGSCSVQGVCEEASECLAAHVVLLSGDHRSLQIVGCYPRRPRFDTIDKVAMRWAMSHCVATGRGTGILGASLWRFEPVISGGIVRGLLAIVGRGATAPVPTRTDWVLENALRAAGSALYSAQPFVTKEGSAQVVLLEADPA